MLSKELQEIIKEVKKEFLDEKNKTNQDIQLYSITKIMK